MQAFLHGETMPRKNHDHDPYFPSFTIAWSMVTVHSLPNGQVNGHGHPRISPQWSGQWLLPSKIVFGISKILEYFWLFIKSFTPFTAIFSFICCKIIENSKPPLIFHSKFCPKQVYFLIWQWSLKIFSSMVSPMVTAIQEFSPMVSPMVMAIKKISPMVNGHDL